MKSTSTDCLLAEWLIPSVRGDSSNLARLLECEVAASSQPFSLFVLHITIPLVSRDYDTTMNIYHPIVSDCGV